MNIYQINSEIEQLENAIDDGLLIDEETGELMTFEQALNALRMMRTEKIENIALWIKNLDSDAAAIREEEESLAKRRKAAEAKSARLRAYLVSALVREDGTAEKFSTARCAVNIRKNPVKVAISDEKAIPKEFFTEVITQKVVKERIKDVLERGIAVPGAALVQERSVVIK